MYSFHWIFKFWFTMLQKLSKYEAKAWLCWSLIILPPLKFYVKSNLGVYKQSKNVIFGNFRDSKLWDLVNLELKNCSNLLKSQFRTSKMSKNGIFWAFDDIKIWFHVSNSCPYHAALTSHFENFWSIVRRVASQSKFLISNSVLYGQLFSCFVLWK